MEAEDMPAECGPAEAAPAEEATAETAPTETTEEFLNNVGDRLSANKDVDVGLADILKEHLLTTDPAQDAVAQAKAAIISLAGNRTAPQEEDEAHD